LKHASALPRSYGQLLKLSEGASPQGLLGHCADKAGNIYSVPLRICRVALLLLRQRRSAAGNGLRITIKYLLRTTSGAADYGLGTTIIYMRGAMGIGPGTTAKYLRRTTR
jgi:hypothetical protein